MKEEMLLEYLQQNCTGRENTRKSIVIERALNIRRKELQKLVNRMRQDGVPICSSRDGYFYPESIGDVFSTIEHLEVMEKGLRAAINGMKRGVYKINIHKGGGSAW